MTKSKRFKIVISGLHKLHIKQLLTKIGLLGLLWSKEHAISFCMDLLETFYILNNSIPNTYRINTKKIMNQLA